jgi:hypothetical protein
MERGAFGISFLLKQVQGLTSGELRRKRKEAEEWD